MKAGIISLYYKNRNQGGLLQAYATTAFLRKHGYDAEQICYIESGLSKIEKIKIIELKLSLMRQMGICEATKKLCKQIKGSFSRSKKTEGWELQQAAMSKFEKEIPHSSTVYNAKTIAQANTEYDFYICGSDQVWNTARLLHSVYYLQFRGEKKGIAYAVSMGKGLITKTQRKIITTYLKSFHRIGVRESSLVDILKPVCNSEIVPVLDPTLLLSEKEWDNIENPRLVPKEKYIFCYFLGDSLSQRKQTMDFARSENLRVVFCPYIMGGEERKCDEPLKDEVKVLDAGPEAEFISLIKNAEYVATDSFHGMVFSILYEKKFFVYARDNSFGKLTMNARILDMLKMFGIEERLVNDCSELKKVKDIDYSNVKNILEVKKKESADFLLSQCPQILEG